MKIDIIKAESNDLMECSEIIFTSELGEKYFPAMKMIYEQMKTGMEEGDKIYVAKDCEKRIKGVIWYQQKGMFHVFPYLHMIVVKSDCRNQGIGKKLLDFFEADVLVSGYNRLRTKVFLTVGDFNLEAEKLYLDRGYIQVGKIDGLFRKRCCEKLYMKILVASDVH